jgi:hypothetical protein
MKSFFPRSILPIGLVRSVSLMVAIALFAAPLCAQQPAAPAKPPAQRAVPPAPAPTFENLLAVDSYKLYGEVRNVGQLMSTGGAGDIIEPIIKLADPGKEFKSIVKFLKGNAEALATTRLLFATWPARTGIPNAFVAIEFPTAEEAAKFAPKLETFLPGILPPVKEPTPEPAAEPQPRAGETAQPPASVPARKETAAVPAKETTPVPATSPEPPVERPAFVLSHSGNLVFISEKAFKFEKLHPPSSKPLAEDQNFRIARDRFSAESVFLFFNVQLEDQARPKPQIPQITAEAEAERRKQEEEARVEAEAAERARQDEENKAEAEIQKNPNARASDVPPIRRTSVLGAGPQSTPAPTPTKEEQTRMVASSQIGSMLDFLGVGQPQWPEAVGVALALDNNDYVIRAILIEPPEAKRLPLPFVPQLISGPASTSEAPSVLPDNTELFVSVSIDFRQTYEGMRKQAEMKVKTASAQMPVADREGLDPFAAFERKAGFKLREDLLPVLGNEIALAGSLKALEGVGPFNVKAPPKPSPSPGAGEAKDEKKQEEMFPTLLIAIRDRDAARRLLPKVLEGFGLGEASLLARTEKREDVEIVDYAGFFAYAFVGNFLVLSETPSVRRVVDAYLNRQTLSSNNVFRNSRRWEPRQNLGEIYVSPALMEGYHDEVRKHAGTMEPDMRDFLLALDPTASAITYALSNEGLGTQHEIRLPKNLIITMVAGMSSATKNPPPEANEMIAASGLQMIATAEETYKAKMGKGSYATLDKLIEEKLFPAEVFDKYGYKFDVTVMGDQFEVVAVPREYGKTGKRSFFVDKSGVVRAGDHGGGPATVADLPIH